MVQENSRHIEDNTGFVTIHINRHQREKPSPSIEVARLKRNAHLQRNDTHQNS
jgi:hypothetical protein